MITSQELKKKYLAFFEKKGHKRIPNVSLVPENDPTALFISAGMHPLVPYLLGEPHPLGKRLTSVQRCLRTGDIEFVGDPHHLTFFEMLGNWSLGDYWKEEAISWSWEFLTKELGLPKEKLHVSCFKGDQDAPKDEETAEIWKKLGVSPDHIHFFGKKENWWGPVGETGPCGPDTEMFIDTGGKCRLAKKDCDPSCQCGKYFEIWNDVFMEYKKTPQGKYEPLKQRNVDTGMGVERTTAILQGKNDSFQTELFVPLIEKIEAISGKKYADNKKSFRIIADHLRAATFVIGDGVVPSNVEAGYVVRRLIRGAISQGRLMLNIKKSICDNLAEVVVEGYSADYLHLRDKKKEIRSILQEEEKEYIVVLRRGLPRVEKYFKTRTRGQITGKDLFDFKQTYGMPPEMFYEIGRIQKGGVLYKRLQREFQKAFKKHQEKSRAGAAKKFKGGLADQSETVVKLHTVTHLLHQALRQVLGDHVRQVGSNITPERLRFDFTHPKKMTTEEIKAVEKIINQQIKADLAVKIEMMTLAEAKKKGALAFFGDKYGERVKVYSIGNFSCEVCGGPHVSSTGKIGNVRIVKEQPVGSGKRRLYAQLASSA